MLEIIVYEPLRHVQPRALKNLRSQQVIAGYGDARGARRPGDQPVARIVLEAQFDRALVRVEVMCAGSTADQHDLLNPRRVLGAHHEALAQPDGLRRLRDDRPVVAEVPGLENLDPQVAIVQTRI